MTAQVCQRNFGIICTIFGECDFMCLNACVWLRFYCENISRNFVDTFMSARERPTSLSKWYLHSLICAAACSVWLSRADRNLCHCGSMYLKYNSITTIKKYIEGWGGLKATKCKYFRLCNNYGFFRWILLSRGNTLRMFWKSEN